MGLAFQDVSFISRVDHVELKGWFLPASSDSVILIVNGGFQNRVDPVADTLGLSHDLVIKGYNVLLFDLRGRGESQGKAYSLSYEDKDIGGAIDYLNSRGYPASKIGIMGDCSGAANTCIFASKEEVGGIVLDGCFTSVTDMVYHQASSRGFPSVPVIVFVPGVQIAARVFYGYDSANPIDVVGKINCPIFFIHEENDDLVPNQEVVSLFDASENPSNSYWQIPGTLHSRGYKNYPTEYVARLDKFFHAALKPTSKVS